MQHSNLIPGQGPFKSYPRSGPGQAGLAGLDGWLAGWPAGRLEPNVTSLGTEPVGDMFTSRKTV